MQAKQLRKNMTDAERILWEKLRNRQIAGVRFRRQVPIGEFIADFASHEIRLVIEIDGGQHNELDQIQYDRARTEWFASQGYQVVRFWNNEVMSQLEDVIEMIWDICSGKTPHLHLPPHFVGGRDQKRKIPSPHKVGGGSKDLPLYIPSPHEVWGKVRMGGDKWQNTLNPHLPPQLKPWLLHKSSFMQRLKEHDIHDAKIKVLEESWQMPWESECQLLHIQALALVRVVSIESAEKCWMYARTIFTKAILEGEYACLKHLENRPLGSILFKDPKLVRGEFEYLSVYNAYARRSLFSRQEKSLLLTEVFMPDMMTI